MAATVALAFDSHSQNRRLNRYEIESLFKARTCWGGTRKSLLTRRAIGFFLRSHRGVWLIVVKRVNGDHSNVQQQRNAFPGVLRMTNAREHKEFRIVCKLGDVSRRLPSAADAAFFLRNAVRFERVRVGRSPFQQKEYV